MSANNTTLKFVDICSFFDNCNGCPCAQDCMNNKDHSIDTLDHWKDAVADTIATLMTVRDALNDLDADDYA